MSQMFGLEGNGLLQKVTPVTVDETSAKQAQIESLYAMGTQVIDEHLDKLAKSLRYTDVISARSYAGTVNPFQETSIKFIKYSAQCWVISGNLIDGVIAGTATAPTVDEFKAMLPDFETFTG